MRVEVGEVQFASDEEENGADRVEPAVASGIPNAQAEAVVSVIAESSCDLVTKDFLDARLSTLKAKLATRIYLLTGMIIGGLTALELFLGR